MHVRRLPCAEPLFVSCAFCGSRPVVEVVANGGLRFQARCPMDDGHGLLDRATEIELLALLWASSQDQTRQWLEKDLLI